MIGDNDLLVWLFHLENIIVVKKNDMKNGNFFLTFFHNVVNLSIDNFSDGVVSVC